MVLNVSSKSIGPAPPSLLSRLGGLFFVPAKEPQASSLPAARKAPAGRNPSGPFLALLLLSPLFLPMILCVPGKAGAQAPVMPAADPSAFRLVGTVDSKALSGAVLLDSSGLQSFYRLREKLPDDSQIIKVRSDSILLKRTDGALYELFITQEARSASPAGPAPDIRPPVRAEERKEQGTDEGRRRPPRKERLRQPDQVQ